MFWGLGLVITDFSSLRDLTATAWLVFWDAKCGRNWSLVMCAVHWSSHYLLQNWQIQNFRYQIDRNHLGSCWRTDYLDFPIEWFMFGLINPNDHNIYQAWPCLLGPQPLVMLGSVSANQRPGNLMSWPMRHQSHNLVILDLSNLHHINNKHYKHHNLLSFH